MKNIQVVDGADSSVYDLYAVTEAEYALIFAPGEDVAFIEEVYQRVDADLLDAAFERIWQRGVPKREARGIHGMLFCEREAVRA